MSRWNIVRFGHVHVGFALCMLISCCFAPFCLRWVPNWNVFYDGNMGCNAHMSDKTSVKVL